MIDERLDKLSNDREKLIRALMIYGEHEHGCPRGNCMCGLSAVYEEFGVVEGDLLNPACEPTISSSSNTTIYFTESTAIV